MGLNSFDHMVKSLDNLAILNTINVETNPQKILISLEEYNLFLKDFVFEKLKGKSLSQAFVERFGVADIVLNISLTDNSAESYIKRYYIK